MAAAGPAAVLAPDAAAQRALAQALAQGFVQPQTAVWPGGKVWFFATPGQPTGSGAWVEEGPHFAASVGAFHWKGCTGAQALRRLLAHAGPIDSLPWDEISSSCVLLLGRADGVWLLGDALGLGKVYAAQGSGILSTSLLVCRASMTHASINRLRAQEYVLLGATHGCETPIDGLRALDPTAALDLRSGRSVIVHPPSRLLSGQAPASAEEAVRQTCSELTEEFGHLKAGWGGRMGMALSGGFDSRLLLAALHHVQEQPRLYVYGRAGDEDVVVARAVAGRLGRPIETFEKSALERQRPAITSALLRHNQQFFDGLPLDGIFNRGSDEATRRLQVADDRLNLNGGGGEILRNFFYLPSRSFTAAEVVAAFYSGWFDEVFSHADDRAVFVASLEDKILQALGRDSGSAAARAQVLSRTEVELVYTLFRLRWWMGRNNAVAARYGAFMTPIVTPRLVKMAAAIPIAWKEGGRMEAAVITRLAPQVAAGPSAYGFEFDCGPTWRHRLNVALTVYRPVAVRHYSLKVQRLLGRVKPVTAPPEWCEALGDAPNKDWLNPAALNRLDQMNRLMTLQALAAWRD